MSPEPFAGTFPELQVAAFRGPDARRFLHGQVSQDVLALPLDRVRLCGYHNPQGRVVAMLWLVPDGTEDVLAVLPRELEDAVVARMRRVVLRARVAIGTETDRWRVFGATGSLPAPLASTLAQPGGPLGSDTPGQPPAADTGSRLCASGAWRAWRHPGGAGGAPRWLGLIDSSATTAATAPAVLLMGDASAPARLQWQAGDIAAGLPHIGLGTSELFVAQMLNLDLLGGIAFNKGCYTGQEVIARAHYRGRVKRRLQRFATAAPVELPPGGELRLADQRKLQIVSSVRRADGQQEFLAVGAFDIDAATAAATTAVYEPAAPAVATIDAEPLPLPYVLPV